MTKTEVFAAIRQLGAVRAEVEFSGGNDEGGVDDVVFIDADGNHLDVKLPDSVYEERDYSRPGPDWRGSRTGTWVHHTFNYETRENIKRPATPEEIAGAALSEALSAPVDAEYGSFAGDFSVSGTVTWDTVEGTAIMTRSEQTWSDSDSIEF